MELNNTLRQKEQELATKDGQWVDWELNSRTDWYASILLILITVSDQFIIEQMAHHK